jgi:hypothetical protein
MGEKNRMETAIDVGSEAFWAAVATQFPEIQTGDFAPDAEFALL